MAVTPIQRRICGLLAEGRRRAGDSYIAGGVALNEALAASRISRDIDVFHDSASAVEASFERDRALLLAAGFAVEVLRQRESFVEALVKAADEQMALQWAQDSVFRCFPLVEPVAPCRARAAELRELVASDGVRFHEGRLRGAWPQAKF
jgi:hypothetical protein